MEVTTIKVSGTDELMDTLKKIIDESEENRKASGVDIEDTAKVPHLSDDEKAERKRQWKRTKKVISEWKFFDHAGVVYEFLESRGVIDKSDMKKLVCFTNLLAYSLF